MKGSVKHLVERAASGISDEFGGGPPPSIGHSKALDAVSRILGAGSCWHEAAARAGSGGPSTLVTVEETSAGHVPGWDASLDPEGPWFALSAIAPSLPSPPGWSPSSWNSRGRLMWRSLEPAIVETVARKGGLVSIEDLRELSSWEGIGSMRLDKSLSEKARESLGRWARPWHSAHTPPRDAFLEVSLAWEGVLSWLDESAARPGDREASIRSGRVLVEWGNPFCACLARALCRRNKINAFSPPNPSVQTGCRFPPVPT